MNHTARLILAVLATTAWGCDKLLNPSPPSSRRLPKPTVVVPIVAANGEKGQNTTKTLDPGTDEAKDYVLLVRIQVVTIEVPAGTVSNSERIWSYLDEELVGAQTLVNLGRNGFRIGVGRRDSWPDVARILKDITGRGLKQTILTAKPSDPIPFIVKQRQGVQTIFTFYPDRTCSGRDYPNGDNLLTFACTFDPDDPSKVMVVGVPQIRTTQHRPRILKGAGPLRIVDKPTVFTFDPLMFRLRFRGGDFLVIGPGVQAGRTVGVGHHFLIKRRKGVPFETVLVLIPEVVAAPISSRRAGPLGGLRTPARNGG